MRDPRIQLKDPRLAALLTWLIPGAGQFYQGRIFKGTIYAVCILGLFLSGLAMADWTAVQPPDLRRPTGNKTLLLKYSAQVGVGLPGLFALAQSRRFASEQNIPTTRIDSPLAAEFEGVWLQNQYPQTGGEDVRSVMHRMQMAHEDVEYMHWPLDGGLPAAGRITLAPHATDLGGMRINGTFTGTIDGEATDIVLDQVMLEEPVRANARRRVFALGRDPQSQAVRGVLVASVPRPFLNYVSVPMSPREENQLHARHGNFLEIWLVFTWIAGLLNMLAIWDAYDGPAYAYGDEQPDPASPGVPPAGPPPDPAPVPATAQRRTGAL